MSERVERSNPAIDMMSAESEYILLGPSPSAQLLDEVREQFVAAVRGMRNYPRKEFAAITYDIQQVEDY